MNEGQEKFLTYIMERVEVDKAEEAKALLADSFKKQTEGNFTREDIEQFIPKITALLKPDKVEEVLAVMKDFSNNLNH